MPGAFMHGQRGDIFSVEFYDPSVGLDDANDHVKTSGFAIAALVCGIVALFSTLIGSLILATLAVVFGLIAINKISKNPTKFKGKGMAWAGYIIGLVAVLIWTLIL